MSVAAPEHAPEKLKLTIPACNDEATSLPTITVQAASPRRASIATLSFSTERPEMGQRRASDYLRGPHHQAASAKRPGMLEPGKRPSLPRMKSALRAPETPFRELTTIFVCYKAVLLLLALCASWTGEYDSSSTLVSYSTRLMHWDSVYFQHIARHGYVYEQEHAFGPLLPLLLRFIHPMVLGCACHYIAIIALYRASLNATSSERISKVAAILHIISPAGIFLCVGYTEPLFCALTFSGVALLHKYPKVAASLFGLSGLTRATGIINAFYFFPKRPDPTRLVNAGLAGAVICGPWFLTQAVAYMHYCPGRPWCDRFPPIVYSFVQDHYWHVGFGRYFTLNNLPLFLLSAPSYLLCLVSLDVSLSGIQQGLLTFLTFTTAHAQIITRMMAAFPGVYWFLARRVVQENESQGWRWAIHGWILYGLCQAVLFGAHLPPA
ncbi:hypothetical protein BCR37DRAFT_46236 [Protomyces lactucae-debilis]|uniref:GPI mannosyltransferase 2 n=1 Tax=Protomyces lactucae-debilis TaxID=2754530 RepID=A0A1Y2FC56_PROLT|nr:uncharacterized protein BCR37DRAFT_46236 [Protomyces lactucae-debilis]ORY81493.1 hypothetical protein BCR37DRAFT_46236 [Protomyces lactucae-debilis]